MTQKIAFAFGSMLGVLVLPLSRLYHEFLDGSTIRMHIEGKEGCKRRKKAAAFVLGRQEQREEFVLTLCIGALMACPPIWFSLMGSVAAFGLLLRSPTNPRFPPQRLYAPQDCFQQSYFHPFARKVSYLSSRPCHV